MKQSLKNENPIGYCLLPVLVFLLGKQGVYGLLLALLQKMEIVSQGKMEILANGLTNIILIPVMWYWFVKRNVEDIQQIHLFQRKRDGRRCLLSLLQILPLCLLGISACLAGNGLLQLTGLTDLFAGDYSTTMGHLYGGTLCLQIFWMVIAAPVAEELVYRRILYRRVREYWSFWPATIGTSLLFGMTHGFILQGIYGFLLGMLFCFLMERYRSWYPAILAHMAANLCSVVSTVYPPIQLWLEDWRHFTVAALSAVVVCILIAGYLIKTNHTYESEERK